MSAVITPATLDTVLGHLALLFLTGAVGDLTVARQAAARMLAGYNAETPEELRLATEVISFGFHALEALSQAAEPGQSLNKKLRLRGSAVTLSRESHKSQRKLDQLQRARRAGAAAQLEPLTAAPEEPTPDQANTEQAERLVAFARDAIAAAGKDNGKSWTKAYQQRETAKRIAKNLKKRQAQHAALPNEAALAA
jgi:hypothetical protein